MQIGPATVWHLAEFKIVERLQHSGGTVLGVGIKSALTRRLQLLPAGSAVQGLPDALVLKVSIDRPKVHFIAARIYRQLATVHGAGRDVVDVVLHYGGTVRQRERSRVRLVREPGPTRAIRGAIDAMVTNRG